MEVECRPCNGIGFMDSWDEICPHCGGIGEVSENCAEIWNDFICSEITEDEFDKRYWPALEADNERRVEENRK